MDSIRINGLHTNVSPFQMLVAGFAIIITSFALLTPETYEKNENFWEYETVRGVHMSNQLNGVSIAILELTDDFCMR